MSKPTSKIFILETPTPGNIFLLSKLTESHTQSTIYYHPPEQPEQQEPVLSYFPQANPCSLDHNCSNTQQCCQKIKDLGDDQAFVLIGCPHSKDIAPDIINHYCPDAKLQNQMDLGQRLLVVNPESETFDVKTAPFHLRLS